MSRIPGAGWALLLPSRPGLRVLEVGVGLERAEALRAEGARVTCLRFSVERATEAQARGFEAHVAEGLEPESFDLALIGELPRAGVPIDTILGAVAPALASGGALVVTQAGRPRAGGGLARSVQRAGFGDVRVFATLRDETSPKYLVPLDHPGAASYFFGTVVPRRPGAIDRGLVRIASTLTRFGFLDHIAPGRHLLATKPPAGTGLLVESWLRAEAAAVVGPERARDVRFVVVAGWRSDGTTLTALGFESGARAPSFVAKVATGASVTETSALRRNLEILGRAFEGDGSAPIPRLLHAAERAGASVLFESVVPGKLLRVPTGSAALRALAFRVSSWLLDFHRRTGPGGVALDPATAQRLLLRPFEAYRTRFRPGAEEAAFLDRAARQARALAEGSFPLVLPHGDFCPANLVEHQGEIGVLDWETPLEPALPAQDLIHFLACLGAYEDVFFSRGPRARIARDVLLAYARALGVPVESLETLFTIFWIDYAVEKEALGSTVEDSGGQPWGLARLERGTCVNVERLARARDEFFLRG